MSTLKNVVIVTVFLAGGIAIGFAVNRSETHPAAKSHGLSAQSLAGVAVETAASDPKKIEFILRCAIKKLGETHDECNYVWNAIREIEKQQILAKPQMNSLKEEFIRGIDSSAAGIQSSDELEKLYSLRAEAIAAIDVQSTEKAAVAPPGPASQLSHRNDGGVNQGEIATLFEEGLTTSDSDRAELLTQMAIRIQETTPAVAPLLWNRYHEYLDKKKLTPEESVLRLSTYLDSIDKAAIASHSGAEFQAVWDVRKSVFEQRSAVVESLKSAIGTDLNNVTEQIRQLPDKDKHVEAIKKLSQIGEDVLPKLHAIKVAFPIGRTGPEAAVLPKEVTDKLAAAVKEVLSVVSNQVAAMEKERDREAKEDREGNAHDPGGDADTNGENNDASPEVKTGRYEALAQQIVGLRQLLDEADIQSWLAVMGNENKEPNSLQQKPSTPPRLQLAECERLLGEVQKKIESLSVDVSRRQGLRYNLWALGVIYRAQQSNNWDGILGRIDVALLQPTVSVLYSSTYDLLIKDKTDARTRIVAVQNILNGKKIALSAF